MVTATGRETAATTATMAMVTAKVITMTKAAK